MYTVTIMYRGSWFDRNSWAAYPMTVEIADACPVCGGPRGEPKPYRFYENGDWFNVSRWDNECQHIDRYQDVYAEAMRSNDPDPPAVPDGEATEIPAEIRSYSDLAIELHEAA